VTYATYLYNHSPNDHSLCPANLFTGSTVLHHWLKDIHVWRCPVYVLDPHLKAGQKIPCWEPRSCRGVFLGFSPLHSSQVPLHSSQVPLGNNRFLLTQSGLIHKVLATTRLQDYNDCTTPTSIEPLHTNENGAPFVKTWAYDSIIGMLMYLAGNTCPDISYAVHQAARFTHCPRRSHAAGVKRILCYLKQTRSEGLILNRVEHNGS
jgi:hypothetical protein